MRNVSNLVFRVFLVWILGSKVAQDELQQAEEKLQESLDIADNSMFNLLSCDVSFHQSSTFIQ